MIDPIFYIVTHECKFMSDDKKHNKMQLSHGFGYAQVVEVDSAFEGGYAHFRGHTDEGVIYQRLHKSQVKKL